MCTKPKLLRDLIFQQVAREGRRWEQVRDDVPNLRSLLHRPEESLGEQCLTLRYLGSVCHPK